MGSEKNISAVLLVVCPIVVFAMYFTLLSTVGDADWSDIKGVTLLLGQDCFGETMDSFENPKFFKDLAHAPMFSPS